VPRATPFEANGGRIYGKMPAARACACGCASLTLLSSSGPGDHHVDIPAAAFRAHQPLAPVGYGRLGAIPLGHLSRIGLDAVPAGLAPDDEPNIGRAALPSVIAVCVRFSLFDKI